jgi:DNA-binding LacI/PurR family transcriptional regulator
MSRPPHGHPTMDDVAAAAGVSRALVSLVFRDSPNVSDERRARVIEAARRLGYRPNAMARTLASKSSGTIGVLLNDLHNPFFAEIYDGIEDAAADLGYRVLLTTSRQRDQGEQAAIETMLEHRVDGMVLTSPRLPAPPIVAAGEHAPVVVVGRKVVGDSVDNVMADETLGSMLAVQHLADLGHRAIVHIDGGRGAGATARRSGFRKAMHRLGLDEPDVVAGDFTEQSGVDAAETLLRRRSLPTALFAANDLVAIGAMATLADAGFNVPDDISIVGYDNTALARLRHVSLTTIEQPLALMGRHAMSMLHDRIEGRRRTPQTELVTPRLVARRTTTSPRAGR